MPKKGKKRGKYHTDERGHYVWENFFVRGKQRRRKQRVTVIDGEIIDDPDTWLLANAGDDFLHQIERWDLIGQRMLEEEGPETGQPAMKPPPRKLRLDIDELEAAFDFASAAIPDYDHEACIVFLDLTTGKVVAAEVDEETETLLNDGNHLILPSCLFEELSYGALDEFVASLPEDQLRGQLVRAIRGKGAFRRFKSIVFGDGNVALKHRWTWFETRRKRECIAGWLTDHNIEPDWGRDIYEAPPSPDKRTELLRAVLDFVRNARAIPGVRRIALLGSLATPKPIPKDVDLLVEVSDDMPLETLARLSRRLLGSTMATGDGCGADVFLCNLNGKYLGRVCSWKTCAPGIRRACQALNCGRRTYLHDDLQSVHLDPTLIAAPPLDLWPKIIARTDLPDDVRKKLAAGLR